LPTGAIKIFRNMKQLIFVIALILGFITKGFAHDMIVDTSKPKLFKVSVNYNRSAEWHSENFYSVEQFNYKGRQIAAWYNAVNNVAGFSRSIDAKDLPAAVSKCLKRKFGNYLITNAMLFINSNGEVLYFAGLQNNKKYIAVEISDKCATRIMQKISMK